MRQTARNRFKRMAAALLTLCMLLTLFPAALAVEPTGPDIPGYTQLTELPEGGLDTTKYYLVVTKDSDGNLYALYINQAGTSVGSGSLTGASGRCTAALTVSGDTVTASYLADSSSLNMDDLRITVNTSGNGYTFRSGDYGLAISGNMFGTDSTALSVSVSGGNWTIQNNSQNRVLGFNKVGDSASQYPQENYITDFWGGRTATNFPIYLYVQDGTQAPVDKAALDAAIAEADELNEENYTNGSWQALQSALTAAQQVSANPAATQEAVNQACAALESTLDALVGLVAPPEEGTPTVNAYIQDTDGIDSGAIYAIYTSENSSTDRILYHTGSGKTDKLTASVSGTELALNSGFDASRQLWTITTVSGGYSIQSVDSNRYLDLSQSSTSNLATSPSPVTLTINFNQETGLYTIASGSNYLSFNPEGNTAFQTSNTAYNLRLYKQTQVEADIVEREELVPQPGTTQAEPFAPGTGGSDNFRIPSIITLDSGRILAAIDARWNHLMDACSLDTILSYSDDGGATWHYSFPNYFGDSVDAKQNNATAFIDPVMTQGKDGTIYLLVDLFPGGVAINTAPMRPAQTTGYVEINGVQRLVLYTTPVNNEQTDTNYAAYVGDFVNGYAQIYDATDHSTTGYYVDDHYYLYFGDGSSPEEDKIYCQQLGSSKYIQQNVFFYNAALHVRCATYLWLVTSKDNGQTWSAPTILNPQVRTGDDMFYGVGPGAGLCLEDGTIILPAYTYSNQIASFIYSSDGGATWHRSDDATPSGHWSSESCLVQIDSTTVRHFYRNGYSTLYYTDHTWNGQKWVAGTPVSVDVPRTSNNQLSAIRYSQEVDGKPAILVSTATGASGSRTNGKIYTFLLNEDKTMELVNTYEVTASGVAYGYSSLTELEDGSIALLYEAASSRSTFEVIPAAQLIPGEGSEETPAEGNATLSITGSTQISKGDTAKFTISLGGNVQADTLKLTFTVSDDQNGGLMGTPTLEGLSDFVYSDETTQKINSNGSITYETILYVTLGQNAAQAPLDVLSVQVPTKDTAGNLTVTLNSATFAVAGGSEQAVDIAAGRVTTAVKSITFDVNGDGKVDVGDVSAVRKYYASKSGDANWNEAQKADLNSDNVVDLEDLILVAQAVLNGSNP